MATNPLAADVRPAKITRTYNPANDNKACWTTDPRAALLLASMRTSPPVGQFHRQRFGFSTDEWFAYVGYRAEALEMIRTEIGSRLLAFYEEHGEAVYEPFRQWCEQPDVTKAIDAALGHC